MSALESSGVIPYRWSDGRLEVLLITSRRTGRWAIPKGWLEPGMTPLESALLEAYEEAGVRGEARDELLGTYVRWGRTVGVYPLEVREVLDDWPEARQRRRAWFSLEEAVAEVEEDDLKAILRAFL
ncbi:MAG: NUDIX hydrolase [Candidatus Eremiobacterota bacterium]